MSRSLILAALLMTATGAQAQSLANGYVATPAAPSQVAKFTTRGTPWFRRGEVYVAPHAPERTPQVCAMVVKKVGKLASFTVAGQPYPAEDLANCNATID